MIEGDLAAEDRLSGAGVAEHQIHAAAQKAAFEDGIEPGDPARDTLELSR
jgi:hypothetical protein